MQNLALRGPVVDMPTGEPCAICGYNAPDHASYCRNKARNTCPVCGADENTPGVLRQELDITDPQFGKPIPCPECYARKMVNRAKEEGQLTGELKTNTFDNFGVTERNKAAYQAAIEFAANPVGWLTLYPDYGGGKTHLCAAIANKLGKGRCIYFNTPDLTDLLRDIETRNKVLSRVAMTPVIILDELDKAHITAWTRDGLQRFFDHRYREWENLGLVIASNDEPEEFTGDLEFVGNRMRDERFKCVEIRGNARGMIASLRRLAGAQRQSAR